MQAVQPQTGFRWRSVILPGGIPARKLVNRDIQGVNWPATSTGQVARVLAGMGLCLENSLYHPQLPELAALARAVPDLTIILNHIGGPGASRLVRPSGRRSTARMAAGHCGRGGLSNVIIKLGGVGQRRFGFDWHARAKPIGSERAAAALSPLDAVLYRAVRPRPAACSKAISPVDKVSYS